MVQRFQIITRTCQSIQPLASHTLKKPLSKKDKQFKRRERQNEREREGEREVNDWEEALKALCETGEREIDRCSTGFQH